MFKSSSQLLKAVCDSEKDFMTVKGSSRQLWQQESTSWKLK